MPAPGRDPVASEVEGLAAALRRVTWTDGGVDGLPTTSTSLMLARGLASDWLATHDAGVALAAVAPYQAAVEQVRALHPKVPVQPRSEECADENHTHDAADNGVDVCWDCPPIGFICGSCFDGDGGDPEDWPCPTAAVLASVPPSGECIHHVAPPTCLNGDCAALAAVWDEAVRTVAGVDPAAIHNPYREDTR